MPLSVNQQRAVSKALEILEASQERMRGRSGKLVEIVKDLNDEPCGTPEALFLSQSVNASPGLTFKSLSALYMEERKDSIQASTMRDVKSSCEAIGAVLGDLDMKSHTREEMKGLRDKLLEDRKPSTVKKLLTRLSTVMDWAVNNGYLDKSFDKGLSRLRALTVRVRRSLSSGKGSDDHANSLPVDAWQRWALSLGAITGTRIEELEAIDQS